jgi:hypothetical protein
MGRKSGCVISAYRASHEGCLPLWCTIWCFKSAIQGTWAAGRDGAQRCALALPIREAHETAGWYR